MDEDGGAARAQGRRVEEASLNAWPALTQLLYDGWIVRQTHGFTRRANSVTPLAEGGARPLLEKVRWCENLYARAGQPTLFRLPDCAPVGDLAVCLEARGYSAEAPSTVLSRPLPTPATGPARGHRVTFTDRGPWLAVYAGLTGQPDAARHLHGLVLKGIAGDCLHAVIHDEGTPVACALGVVEDDLLGLFDLFTAPQARRRGLARALVEALETRGASAGARRVYLQVDDDNAAAARLYAALEYTPLYRYHYLRAPA
jgi:ribosomal protein S18 acetylase RimI-like enzyme